MFVLFAALTVLGREVVGQGSVDRDYVKVGFGSCVHQRFKNLKALPTMALAKPDLIMLLGDNVYLDKAPKSVKPKLQSLINPKNTDWYKSLDTIKGEYDKLLAHKDYLITKIKGYNPTVLATYDDHDFGKDNAGGEFEYKDLTRQGFLYFMNETNKHDRVSSEMADLANNPKEGIQYFYDSEYDLDDGTTLIIRSIMLDVRWYKNKKEESILGDEQWKWLAGLLEDSGKDASIDWVLIGMGTTFYLSDTDEEDWSGDEKKRLIKMTHDFNLRHKTILLSGDVHYSAIYRGTDDHLVPEFIVSSFSHGYDKKAIMLYCDRDDNNKFGKKLERAEVRDDQVWNGCTIGNMYGMLKLYKNKLEFGAKNGRDQLLLSYCRNKNSSKWKRCKKLNKS